MTDNTEQPAPQAQKQIQSKGFTPVITTFDEGYRMANLLASSAIVPQTYRSKPEDCMVAMMLGTELGLNPIQSLQNIAVINGRPCLWGDSMLAVVQAHPTFGGISETFDDATMTATCSVKRKDGSTNTVTFSKADAETAGLWGKNVWKSYPKRMLSMRARGFALRNLFADALCGLISAEEAGDIPEGEKPEPIQMGEAKIVSSTLEDDQFKSSLEKWTKAIESGKRTAGDIIEAISEKNKVTFTDKQKATLNQIKPNDTVANSEQ